MKNLVLSVLSPRLAVCRLDPRASLATLPFPAEFFSITRTGDELSIVCDESDVPDGAVVEPGWRALKVEGPLDFSLTGILAGLAGALAGAGISLFAISTYDTDYVLVRGASLPEAVSALRSAGYFVRE